MSDDRGPSPMTGIPTPDADRILDYVHGRYRRRKRLQQSSLSVVAVLIVTVAAVAVVNNHRSHDKVQSVASGTGPRRASTTTSGPRVTTSSSRPSATTTTTIPLVLPGVPGCSTNGSPWAVRPTSIVLACADYGIVVDQAHWSSWTGVQAIGSGIMHQNDCAPACYDGHFHTQTADLTLYAPGFWHGHLVFTRLRVHLHGPLPPSNDTTHVYTLV